MLTYDAAGTTVLQTEKKVIQFKKWLEAHNVYSEKINFPALFKVRGAQPDSQSGPDPPETNALGDASEEAKGIRGLVCS